MDYEKVPKIFHEVTKDHKRMYDILKLTDFNWIAVFPPQFIGINNSFSNNYYNEYRSIDKLKCVPSA